MTITCGRSSPPGENRNNREFVKLIRSPHYDAPHSLCSVGALNFVIKHQSIIKSFKLGETALPSVHVGDGLLQVRCIPSMKRAVDLIGTVYARIHTI